MNKAIVSILILFLTSGLAFSESLSDLAALSGCWEGKLQNRTYEEQWMEPAGNMMLGMSRTMKDGNVINYEFLKIQKREDGTFYIASPSEQNKNEFRLKSFDANKAIFEDPQHDFPQRVIYHFQSGENLHAWIEGESEGRLKKVEYPMVRVKCPGGL